MDITRENAKSIVKNLNVNIVRVISALVLITSGIMGLIFGKKKDNKKVTALSTISSVVGLVLFGLELEDNFKPIEENEEVIE